MRGEGLTSTPHHPLLMVANNFDHYPLLIYHNYHFSFYWRRLPSGSEISGVRFTNISTDDIPCFKFPFYIGILESLF